jgi:hypothetical protein
MRNEMHDLSNYRRKNLNYLDLLKRGSEGNKGRALLKTWHEGALKVYNSY